VTLPSVATPAPRSTPADTLWYSRCPVPTASAVAIGRGLLEAEFAGEGIAVRSLVESPDGAVREAHFDHRHPAMFRHGGNVPPLWARAHGADTRLLGLTWVDQFQGVLAMPGSGIAEPADLRGRRVAIPRRRHDAIDFWAAITLRGLTTAAALGGVAIDDLELVDVGVGVEEGYLTPDVDGPAASLFGPRENTRLWATEALALARGELDAIYVYGPLGLELATFFDAVVVVDLGRHPDRSARIGTVTPALLTVSGRLLDERPDLVERWLATLLRAADWAQANRDDATRVFAAEMSAAESWTAAALDPATFTQLRPSLDDVLVEALADQQRFLRRHGFIPAEVDLDRWLAPEPLEAALRASARATDRTTPHDQRNP